MKKAVTRQEDLTHTKCNHFPARGTVDADHEERKRTLEQEIEQSEANLKRLDKVFEEHCGRLDAAVKTEEESNNTREELEKRLREAVLQKEKVAGAREMLSRKEEVLQAKPDRREVERERATVIVAMVEDLKRKDALLQQRMEAANAYELLELEVRQLEV